MNLDPVITFKISIKCLDMENENIKQDTWMGKDLVELWAKAMKKTWKVKLAFEKWKSE